MERAEGVSYEQVHRQRTEEIIQDFNGDYKRLAAYTAKLELDAVPPEIKVRVDEMINLLDVALTD